MTHHVVSYGDRLNQVCGIHTKFSSQVIKDMYIACLLFGILPLGEDFEIPLMNLCCPPLGKLTRIFAPSSNLRLHVVYTDRCINSLRSVKYNY